MRHRSRRDSLMDDFGVQPGGLPRIPLLFIPLSVATMAAHWSLVHSRGHYVTDVLAGGALAVVVAAVAWKVWPPGDKPSETDETPLGRTDDR